MTTTALLQCLIVEDEQLPAELLSDYIRQTPWLALAGICTDAVFAIDFLKKNHVDVLFLDIHLPQIKGLDMLALLPNPPLVVLTTAYHQYALESYRYDVVDYLLKPYDFARFLEAVEKVRRRIAPAAQPPEAFFVPVNKQQVRIAFRDIIYIESLKEYCKIHLAARYWVTQSTLTEMEEKLPADQFLRIHRSFIINVNQLTTFTATAVTLGKITLPIGKTYQGTITAKFNL